MVGQGRLLAEMAHQVVFHNSGRIVKISRHGVGTPPFEGKLVVDLVEIGAFWEGHHRDRPRTAYTVLGCEGGKAGEKEGNIGVKWFGENLFGGEKALNHRLSTMYQSKAPRGERRSCPASWAGPRGLTWVLRMGGK